MPKSLYPQRDNATKIRKRDIKIVTCVSFSSNLLVLKYCLCNDLLLPSPFCDHFRHLYYIRFEIIINKIQEKMQPYRSKSRVDRDGCLFLCGYF